MADNDDSDENERDAHERANAEDHGEGSTLSGVFERDKRMAKVLEPPAVRALRELTDRFQPLLKQQEQLRDILESPAIQAMRAATERQRKVVGALGTAIQEQKRLRDLFDPAAAPAVRSLIESTRAAHAQYASLAMRLGPSFSTPLAIAAHQSALGTQAISMTLQAAHCDALVGRISMAEMGISTLTRDLEVRLRAAPGWVSADFASRHREAAVDVVRLASDFGVQSPEDAPPGIATEVPTEAFRALDADATLAGCDTSEAANTARAEIAEGTSDGLRQLIRETDPAWVTMLDGARAALESDNPDRLRHTLTSLRELFTKVLHVAAPDEAIKRWSSEPSHFHNGRPTRRARLIYLYGTIGEASLRAFAETDIAATLDLLGVLQKGTHSPQLGASDQEARVIACRVEGTLLFILRLVQMSKEA